MLRPKGLSRLKGIETGGMVGSRVDPSRPKGLSRLKGIETRYLERRRYLGCHSPKGLSRLKGIETQSCVCKQDA